MRRHAPAPRRRRTTPASRSSRDLVRRRSDVALRRWSWLSQSPDCPHRRVDVSTTSRGGQSVTAMPSSVPRPHLCLESVRPIDDHSEPHGIVFDSTRSDTFPLRPCCIFPLWLWIRRGRRRLKTAAREWEAEMAVWEPGAAARAPAAAERARAERAAAERARTERAAAERAPAECGHRRQRSGHRRQRSGHERSERRGFGSARRMRPLRVARLQSESRLDVRGDSHQPEHAARLSGVQREPGRRHEDFRMVVVHLGSPIATLGSRISTSSKCSMA